MGPFGGGKGSLADGWGVDNLRPLRSEVMMRLKSENIHSWEEVIVLVRVLVSHPGGTSFT